MNQWFFVFPQVKDDAGKWGKRQVVAASPVWLCVPFCTVVTWCVEVVVRASMHVDLNLFHKITVNKLKNCMYVCV